MQYYAFGQTLTSGRLTEEEISHVTDVICPHAQV
jgi:hypothetical protein